MMTGQILGGSPVLEAARYQMLIIYLIASACFGSTVMILRSVMKVAFDLDHMVRTDRIVRRETKKTRNKTKKTKKMMITKNRKNGGDSYGNGDGEADALMGKNDKDDDGEARRYVPVPPSSPPLPFVSGGPVTTTLRSVQGGRQNLSSPSSRNLLLLVQSIGSVVCLHRCRGNKSDESNKSDDKYDENDNNGDDRDNYDGSGRSGHDRTLRVLFRNVSLTLSSGEILSVSGSSGCGKSHLLQVLAGLCPNFYDDGGGGEG